MGIDAQLRHHLRNESYIDIHLRQEIGTERQHIELATSHRMELKDRRRRDEKLVCLERIVAHMRRERNLATHTHQHYHRIDAARVFQLLHTLAVDIAEVHHRSTPSIEHLNTAYRAQRLSVEWK